MPPGRATSVAALGHQALALVHGVDDVQLREPGMADLALHQRARDHADHAAAGGERRVRHAAHQAGAAAAVDELPAALRDAAPHCGGGRGEGRVRPSREPQ